MLKNVYICAGVLRDKNAVVTKIPCLWYFTGYFVCLPLHLEIGFFFRYYIYVLQWIFDIYETQRRIFGFNFQLIVG
jgi:hypothetical protein